MATRSSAALLLAACCAGAWAQRTVNRCVVGGQVVLSDKPCNAGGATQLTAIGPQAQPRTQSMPPSYQPGLPRAPEHLRYLSPECAQLNDAIRTAPSRGIGYATIGELRAEYGRKCSEDESQAQMQRYQDESRQRQDRQAARRAEQAEVAAVQRQREQCAQLQEVLQSRRRREATLNDADRAALARSQASYDARCLGR